MSKRDANLLDREFQYYLDHQEEIVKQYDGRVVAIKNGEVIGVYDSEAEAVVEARKEHEVGTFLVQRVSPGEKAYTQTFRSRVRG